MNGYPSEKRGMSNTPQQQVNVYQNQPAFNGQQQYGAPIMVSSYTQRTVVVNQAIPSVVIAQNPVFGTLPVSIICPFCRQPITTIVEKSFNCATCLLCWCTGLLLFICIQMCSNKEIGCCDAIHKCPVCGNIIGQYSSC